MLLNDRRSRQLSFRRLPYVVAIATAFPALAMAATPPSGVPSSGTILQQTLPATPSATAPGSVLKLPSRPTKTSHSTVQIPVRQIRFEGNHLIPSKALKKCVRAYVGHKETLADLQQAAAKITQLYQKHGYPLAYAYLPPQSVSHGIIRIAVVEPKYDQIHIKGHSRLSPGQARRTLGLTSGEYIKQGPLNRGLLLLSRTPGIYVQGTLVPGSKPRTSSLDVGVYNLPVLSGTVEFENHGSDYTGRLRTAVDLNVANPFGYGSQLSVSALGTQGWLLHAGSFTATSPDLLDGLRAGIYGSRTSYRLGGAFASLGESGRATQLGVDLVYPVFIQPGELVSARFDVYRDLFSQLNTTANTFDSSHINLERVMFSTALADSSGFTSATISATHGDVLLDSAYSRFVDAMGANTAGSFWTGDLRVSRHQDLPARFRLTLSASGQLASKNLGGSQKFFLGGPTGVMSYPVGEAGGDEGVLGTLRLAHSIPSLIPGHMEAALLAQDGAVWFNRDPYPGVSGPGSENLSGVGAELNYGYDGLSCNLSYDYRLGGLPATAGTAHHGEVWFSLKMAF